MNDNDMREMDRGLRYVLTRVAIVVTLVALAGLAWWGVTVAFAPTKGEGDAIRSREAAPNRIAAQELFEHRYQEILAADRNITNARQAVDADPGSAARQTEYRGLIQYCNQLVGAYNADARSYTSEQFRAVDLPPQIDLTNSDTNCKEN